MLTIMLTWIQLTNRSMPAPSLMASISESLNSEKIEQSGKMKGHLIANKFNLYHSSVRCAVLTVQ